MSHSEGEQLQVLLVSLLKHPLQLLDLRDAALSRNNGSDCVLHGSPLSLQVLDLLDHDRGVLLRFQPVDAVEEYRSVVVRD